MGKVYAKVDSPGLHSHVRYATRDWVTARSAMAQAQAIAKESHVQNAMWEEEWTIKVAPVPIRTENDRNCRNTDTKWNSI